MPVNPSHVTERRSTLAFISEIKQMKKKTTTTTESERDIKTVVIVKIITV